MTRAERLELYRRVYAERYGRRPRHVPEFRENGGDR